MSLVYSENRGVEVRDSTLCPGRGVFALRAFAPGETIEICPVLPIPKSEHARVVGGTFLLYYQFPWRTHESEGAIVLGFGSLYNHADVPNARHVRDFARVVMRFEALRPIAAGEEVAIHYGGGNPDFSPWW